MFGYVVPDKDNMLSEEFTLYSAFYCGICKQIGLEYGQIRRLTTNYDITFFSAFVFDQLNYPAEFSEERCVGNPLQKKALISPNPLLKRIAALNMIFSYYKAEDNVIDGGGAGSKLVRRSLKKAFLQASAAEPGLNQIVKDGYLRLRDLEKNNETSIDRVADCFAGLLRDCGAELLGENKTENSVGLIYNVGKFVYLADALDDAGEDNKKRRYNPFLAAFGGYKNRCQFFLDNQAAITFIMATTTNRAIECFNDIKFNQSFNMLKNIVHLGLRKKTAQLLTSKTKLRKPKL